MTTFQANNETNLINDKFMSRSLDIAVSDHQKDFSCVEILKELSSYLDGDRLLDIHSIVSGFNNNQGSIYRCNVSNACFNVCHNQLQRNIIITHSWGVKNSEKGFSF